MVENLTPFVLNLIISAVLIVISNILISKKTSADLRKTNEETDKLKLENKNFISQIDLAKLSEETNRTLKMFESELKQRDLVQQAHWHLKYETCLEALQIVDAQFSQHGWNIEGGEKITPIKQPLSTIDARNCLNRLILTCSNEVTIKHFLDILVPQGGEETRADMINLFRKSIRTELGFKGELNLDNQRAWFAKLHGDESN